MSLTVEAAQTELQQIAAWFEDLNRRQSMVSQFQVRAGFLQGWLNATAPEAEPEAEAEAEPEPEPAKPATRRVKK